MERLHESSKILVEHAQHVARIVSNPGLIAMRLQQQAQLWPSVKSVNGYSHSKKPVWRERERDWLVEKFGLRGRLQRIEVIQTEPPFLFITQEDKMRLVRRVHKLLLEKKSFLTYQFNPGEFNYRKIPKISSGTYIFQRPFLRGLSMERNLRFKID